MTYSIQFIQFISIRELEIIDEIRLSKMINNRINRTFHYQHKDDFKSHLSIIILEKKFNLKQFRKMNLAYLKQQLDPFIIQIIKNQNSPSGPYYKLNHNPHIEYQEFLHNYEDEIQEITNKDILNLDDIDELLNHMTKSVGKNRLRPYHNLLPILYVKAFRLYYFEGLNYREIGSRMNISSMTIHNYVKLALDYVKKTLKDRGKL